MGLFSFSLLRKGYTTTPSLKKAIAYLTRTTPSPVFNAWQFRSQTMAGSMEQLRIPLQCSQHHLPYAREGHRAAFPGS